MTVCAGWREERRCSDVGGRAGGFIGWSREFTLPNSSYILSSSYIMKHISNQETHTNKLMYEYIR